MIGTTVIKAVMWVVTVRRAERNNPWVVQTVETPQTSHGTQLMFSKVSSRVTKVAEVERRPWVTARVSGLRARLKFY